MFKKFICFLIFISVFVAPRLSYSLNSSALWRSALLPGWGQYHMQQTPKAYIIGGGTILLFSVTYITYSSAESKYDEYSTLTTSSSVSDFDTKWSDFESAQSINNIFFIVATSAYLYNLVDAAFFGKPKNISSCSFPINLKLAYDDTKIEYNYKF